MRQLGVALLQRWKARRKRLRQMNVGEKGLHYGLVCFIGSPLWSCLIPVIFNGTDVFHGWRFVAFFLLGMIPLFYFMLLGFSTAAILFTLFFIHPRGEQFFGKAALGFVLAVSSVFVASFASAMCGELAGRLSLM